MGLLEGKENTATLVKDDNPSAHDASTKDPTKPGLAKTRAKAREVRRSSVWTREATPLRFHFALVVGGS
jgi:hypothetical protein